jgi:hypothetical protein
MHKKLDDYLEEISHYLTDAEEREEILSELRSHVMERAEQEGGTDAAVEKAIAALGRPQQVAERYLDDKPIIAPAYQRFLFRYTALLFSLHLAFIAAAVALGRRFTIFPFLYIPRLGFFDAVLYLPMAFFADFGAVALFLYFVTRRGGDFRLPWPRFAATIDELDATAARTLAAKAWTAAGAAIMLALTVWAAGLYARFQTVFVVSVNLENFRPLLLPGPGRYLSLAVLAMMTAATLDLFIKLLPVSRRARCWVDAVFDAIALALIGLVLRHAPEALLAAAVPARLRHWAELSLTATLAVVALLVAVDLVTNLVRLGRRRLAK